MRSRFAACVLAIAIAGCGADASAPGNAISESDEAGLTRLELIGKRLFFDISLSKPAGQSCGSCHDPATGFSGNFGSVSGVPLAADGVTLGLRNTPTASYALFTPEFTLTTFGSRQLARGGQFMDGRATSLEAQAGIPFFSAGEMNLASAAELSSRLANASYAPLMLEEFGAGIFADADALLLSATRAIAAFERTRAFAPFSSKLDHAMAGDVALSDLEQEGLTLFSDPLTGNCTRCHAFESTSRVATKLLFTDFSYRALGVPRNPRIPANADPAFFDLGLCGPRRERVADDSLCGTFKVPTLRNVARRRSLMHNGFFSTVRDAVAFHATRDSAPARWYASAIPFDDMPAAFRANVEAAAIHLDERGIDAITAFLSTLDDGFGASRIPGAQ
jgi:cytochrome c peroxidase